MWRTGMACAAIGLPLATPVIAQGTAASRDAAVTAAWTRMCNGGYCEGFPATIRERGEGALLVLVSGQQRYTVFSVSGEPGNWVVRMSPTPSGGRVAPSCLEGIVSGCYPPPTVNAADRARASAIVAGNWRRSAGNLAQQNVPTESIVFDAATADGRIRYKNAVERRLHLAGVTAEGELHYIERTPVWRPMEYRCRVEGTRFQCQGLFLDSNLAFPMTFFRHTCALPALAGAEFPFNEGAVPPR